MDQIAETDMQEIRKRFNAVRENNSNDKTLRSDCFMLINQCNHARMTMRDEKYIEELESFICLLEEMDTK
ncbi:MAG: hypothetical protein IJA81_06655 [Akkermansia sp.]|nr:hypothetical protein [Akkermansia sp.]